MEEDMIQYHKDGATWLEAIPEAAVFRPTMQQFANPLAYIRSIQQEAAGSGACLGPPPAS